jgi:hypothetical protein
MPNTHNGDGEEKHIIIYWRRQTGELKTRRRKAPRFALSQPYLLFLNPSTGCKMGVCILKVVRQQLHASTRLLQLQYTEGYNTQIRTSLVIVFTGKVLPYA